MKWEYWLVQVQLGELVPGDSAERAIAKLNFLGSEGWEAVGISFSADDIDPVVLFKRPK